MNRENILQGNQKTDGPVNHTGLPYFQQIKMLLAKMYSRKKKTHYNLQELNDIADNIKKSPANFKFPEHLLYCKECMEALLVILEAPHYLSHSTVLRYYSIYKKPISRFNFFIFAYHRQLIAIAASILIILLPLSAIRQQMIDIPMEIRSGIIHPEGTPISHNNFLSRDNRTTRIKQGTVFTALKPSVATIYDGITVTIDENSKLAMNRSFFSESIELKNGGISVTVPPRGKRKIFKVQTKIGEVIVRGTIFRVAILESDNKTLETTNEINCDDRTGAVIVMVEHGTVTVKNNTSSLDVKEGYQALIKSNNEKIAVSKSTLLPRHF